MTIAALMMIAAVLTVVVLAWRGTVPRSMLIVGTSAVARQLVVELKRRPHVRRFSVVVDDPAAVDGPLVGVVAGPITRLGAIIAERRPDVIVVALGDRRGRLPVSELLLARVGGVVVEDGVEYYERLTGKIAIEALTPGSLIASRHFRKTHLDLAFGHVLSLLVSIVALAVFAPLFVLIAAAIKLDSAGPVFFVHERVGLRGRRMGLLKFRTMKPVDRPTSEWERDNSDRITRVGRWLRKYRLDELPQLINVLRGELNLVGPRPHPASNVALFAKQIPYYGLRSVIRPGLTGWAQVRQGYANGLQEETEKMRYDLYYIKHMSAWLDLRILFETVRTVLTGVGGAPIVNVAKRPVRWSPARLRFGFSRSRLVGG